MPTSSPSPAPSDKLLIVEAAKLCPGRPSTRVVWRWAREGLKTRGGEVVRLRHGRAGKVIFTTTSWLDEFFQQVADADIPHWAKKPSPAPGPVVTSRRAQREHEKAKARLAAAGL